MKNEFQQAAGHGQIDQHVIPATLTGDKRAALLAQARREAILYREQCEAGRMTPKLRRLDLLAGREPLPHVVKYFDAPVTF